ncbi:MAG: cysteine desulfurase family protein [Pirellulaceae bacterium]
MSLSDEPVYLDNHATTRVDPRVVSVMLPFFQTVYGNAHSTGHGFGQRAREAVEAARNRIAQSVGAHTSDEIVFTSGATESNNLAIQGIALRPRLKGRHIISVQTEHRALLDPLARCQRNGFEVTLLPPRQHPSRDAGRVDVDQLRETLRDDTVLVSVMWANNEIGVIQPISDIARLCRERGVLFHTDATQALGKANIDFTQIDVDLASFSAHKLHGPKGVGALYVRQSPRRTRLIPLLEGGGQEQGFRSGTLNVPGIVGFGRAVELALDELPTEITRTRSLRDRLYQGIIAADETIALNGPALNDPELRLANNLNLCFGDCQGDAMMLAMPQVAVSSGSACTSVNPEPSHVLQAIGRDVDKARSSLRFGLGRFNDERDIEIAVHAITSALAKLRKLAK